jgi:hypothetical protein
VNTSGVKRKGMGDEYGQSILYLCVKKEQQNLLNRRRGMEE